MGFEPSDAVEVKPAQGKGLGVFARRPVRKGEVIERVPVLIMGAEEYAGGVDESLLARYVFHWGEGQIALALGYGSLYNHSYRPNARYNDVGPQTKAFQALRDIAPGEEVTVNYNGEPSRSRKVWFDVVEDIAKSKRADPSARRG